MGSCVSLVAFLVLVVGGLCRVVVALDIGLGTTAVHRVFTSDPSLCTVPLPPPASDVVRCAPNTTATLEDAKALAWKFAPVLKFHPLERYHLQSMNTWFDEASVYLTDYRQFPNSTYNFIVANQTNRDLLGPRTFATLLNGTSSTDAEREQVLFGAPFVDGKSTADMFYTVTDYSDSLWMYNFNLYYSWNGCSNQNVALSFNGTTDVQGYLMCPAGVHEADLERMSMLVCKSDQKIKQIAYSQHAWNEVRDCQVEGQCLFDEETGNPISYVALEGHGNYPESPGNGFHVYTYFGSSLEGFPVRIGLENVALYRHLTPSLTPSLTPAISWTTLAGCTSAIARATILSARSSQPRRTSSIFLLCGRYRTRTAVSTSLSGAGPSFRATGGRRWSRHP
jgi:hypothetical protein